MLDGSQEDTLPREADLRKLAIRQARFHAVFSASNLARFSLAVADDDGQAPYKLGRVEVDLECGIDDQRRYFLSGSVTCDSALICQRCMSPMPFSVQCDVSLFIVRDESDAKQLPRTSDPLIVDEGELIDLYDVVDDELLLNLPFTSYHDNDTCHEQVQIFAGDNADGGTQRPAQSKPEQAAEAEKKDNPFAVLQALKKSDEASGEDD